jgi:L-seryl-tRNA(Ser) seleniumtransferase
LPAFDDCAADTPPIPRLWEYTNMGYDLVTFSGGKDMRGPQCAGLLLGREDLIGYALLNMSPQEDTIGRPCKVGKEENCGMLKALELFLASDQTAILKQYYEQLGVVSDAVCQLPGVTTVYRYNPDQIANHTVGMSISWDPSKINLTTEDVHQQLLATRPLSIQMGGGRRHSSGPPTLSLSAWQLKPGEEKVIAKRLVEILSKGVVKA